MRFVTNLFLDPLFLVVMLAAISLMCYRTGRIRWMQMLAILSGGLLFILIFSPLSIFLAQRLEYRYAVLDPGHLRLDSTHQVHIMVLGGGLNPGEGLTPADQLSGDALARVVEGIRIHRLVPHSLMVTSGYSIRGHRSQADILASTAVDLGVDPVDTLWLPDPTTTREEAAAYRARFGDSTRIILVTSAIHLPRAMGWFRHHGLDPIPAPANHLVKLSPDLWTYNWWPSWRKVVLMDKVFHEYAGLLQLAWVSRR